MKINLKFLKQKQKKYKKDSYVINPNIYWRIVVYVGLMVIFGSFAFGFYLFKDISREPDVSPSNTTNNSEKIKKERIEKVLDYFNEKKKRSNDILISIISIKDPSSRSNPTFDAVVPSVGIEPTSRP